MQNVRPNSIPWPPIVYVCAALLGVLLQRQFPMPWPAAPFAIVLQWLGGALVIAALALEIASALTFRKHKTTILPHRSATTLITSGPFSLSRNPIYLANTMLVLGAGLFFGNGWLVGMAFVAAGTTAKLAIEREEKHLAEKFGPAWKSYERQVRRWI